MEQVSINVKTDKQLKADTEEVLKEMGLNLTTAINVYFRTIVRKREIPFKISVNEDYYSSKEFEEEILRRAKKEKFITKTIAELEAIESE